MKFTLIQALRGFAALWVVMFHISEGRHIEGLRAALPAWSYSAAFDAGHLGVAIFFALSGFVIAHSFRGASITASYFARFAVRRSIRLDPPYWVAILFTVALAFVSARVKHEPFAGVSLGQLAAHLTYTQELLRVPEINTVFWTLTYEVQFYIVLVLGVMAAQRMRVTAGAVLALPLALTALHWSGMFQVPGLFTDLWPCFLIGVFAYWGITSGAYLIAAACLGVGTLMLHPEPFAAISIATGLGLLAAGRMKWLERLNWRPLQFLGAISYSLYLTHNPVCGASFFLLAKARVPEVGAFVATLAACILVASGLWLVIEKPSMALARRVVLRSENRSAIALAAQ